MISKRFEMKEADWIAVKWQAIKFLLPLLSMYLSPIIFILNQQLKTNSFVFSWSMFVPSQYVIGGAILYTLNRIYDPILRYLSEHKV